MANEQFDKEFLDNLAIIRNADNNSDKAMQIVTRKACNSWISKKDLALANTLAMELSLLKNPYFFKTFVKSFNVFCGAFAVTTNEKGISTNTHYKALDTVTFDKKLCIFKPCTKKNFNACFKRACHVYKTSMKKVIFMQFVWKEFVKETDKLTIDLQSIHKRLVAYAKNPHIWHESRNAQEMVKILALVKELWPDCAMS